MRQKIGYDKDRISLILADIYINNLSVGTNNSAVKRKGNGRPLIFADSAVIMGLEIGKIGVLVKRMLL